uniref:SnoaL-like domain-containing protein n=2 Tax=unclassified Mycobacterium TaxID=2642494 RepID=A0A5Q5BQK9_MYCSS
MTVNTHSEGNRASWDELSTVIKTYLVAQRIRDVDTAVATFTPDAEVTDEGNTYRGRDEITAWLSEAGSEYTYTTEFDHASMVGAAYADVVQHLEGNFPGGVADLHYRFTLDGSRISRLAIEP